MNKDNDIIKFKRVLSLDEIAKMYCDICPYCERKIPNQTWFTENIKCRWCDTKTK